MPALQQTIARMFHPEDLYADGTGGAFFDPSHLWGEKDFLARRNLINYSEDLSATGHTNSSTTVATATNPDGATTNCQLTASGANGTHKTAVTTIAASYIYRVQLKRKTGSGNVDISADGVNWVKQTITGSWAWYTVTQTGVAGTSNPGVRIATNTDVVYVSHEMIARADTKNQTYQKITDWTTEQYAWAAANPKPWLRRNALDYTTNPQAPWTLSGTSLITPNQTGYDGASTAFKVTENTTTSTSFYFRRGSLGLSSTTLVPSPITVTLYAKAAERSLLLVTDTGSSFRAVLYNLSNGTVDTQGNQILSATITSVGGGWYKIVQKYATNVFTAFNGTNYFGLYLCTTGGSTGLPVSRVGVVGEGLYIQYPCIVYGSDENLFQSVPTTWDAAYTALAQAAGYPISLYSDRAGTTAIYGPDVVCGKLLDRSGRGNHVAAPTDAARPILRLDANHNWYLQFDGSDDALENSSASALNVGAAGNVTVLACVDSTVEASGGVLRHLVAMGKSGSSFNYILAINTSRRAQFGNSTNTYGATYSTIGLPGVFGFKANASGNIVRDGVTDIYNGSEKTSSNTQYFFDIGACNNGSGVTYRNYAGNIYGIIVALQDMSAARYAQCYRWLWNKGGGVM